MDRIYLVTGANGHLGNTVVKQLLQEGKRVRALVLPGDRSAALAGLPVEVIEGDICNPASLGLLFDVGGPATVIHAAGIVSIASRYDQKVFDVNVGGTRAVIDQCRRRPGTQLVYVSSVHAIPESPGRETIREVTHFDPNQVQGLYAKTKAEASQYVLNYAARGGNALVVHPSGIIGPNDYGRGHLTQLVRDYLSGRLSACVRGGYDFVDVRDVADGILRACEKGKSGECYILSGHYETIPALLQLLSEVSGRRPVRTVLPAWFANLTAPLSELYYKLLRQPPLYTKYSLFTLESNASFSHEKASRELGYTVRDLRYTLRDTVFWLRENGRVKHGKRPAYN